MTSRPQDEHPLASEWLSARNLSVVALVLFVLYAAVVAGVFFPPQLLSPAWQWRLAGSLINSSPIPLMGLALLRITTELGPEDPLLKGRWRLCSQLAVAASLGFLLLVPLQVSSGLLQVRSFDTASTQRIQGAERKLGTLRQAVASATSNAQLNRRLQDLQGPVLGPADLAQPLPLLQAQVRAVLDQAEQQIARERQRMPPTDPWQLLPDLLRNTIASIALSIGFAALAVRPGSEIPFLQEWQLALQRLRLNQPTPQARMSEDDYIRRISNDDEQLP